MKERQALPPTPDLAAAIRSIRSSLNKIREESKKHSDVYRQIAHDLHQAISRANTEPDELSQSIICLANHGWYVDPNWQYSLPERIAKKIADEGYNSVEPMICSYFDNHTATICNRLVYLFPKRTSIIESAFSAHRQQNYELSVPVLLIQADGIAKEIFENYLFISSERKKIAKFEESLLKFHMIQPLIAALASDTTLTSSAKKRGENFVGLNRHLVLHGDSVDYSTRANSLKCISLLSNLCLFREWAT